ncbi:MAG TPA: PTS fructose transporter subunit IIC [Verrucomicrobiae bacterium]|jgi:fructose-specific phosphotransferase system IIC component|nr:PTS fructose transporter subunit IIC [Verrucomicrobiae bacterium]
MKELLQKHKQYLLTGVSYVIPFIACGGILIALSLAYAFQFHHVDAHGAPDISQCPTFVQNVFTIGVKAFELFPAVLAGFISYGMAGKPGLVPGFVGGFIAALPQTVDGKSASAGFLGALIIGLIAGHVVNLLKKLPMPKIFKPVMPIIIIPILSALAAGLLMLALNVPIATIMVDMGHVLENLQSGSQVFLAMVLGAMIAFDMGGPVNKAAFFFGAAMIQQSNYTIMGACAAAICTPPLGLGLATLLSRKRWTEEQRESGLAALGMGLIGITEGAIPFAAGDPFRVIPSIMLGSMVASTIAMLGGVGDHAPHGGPIVLPVVDHRIMFVVAIIAGALTTAAAINTVKKFTEKSTPVEGAKS